MKLVLLAGTANPGLAQSVAEELGTPPGGINVRRFPDGELSVEIEESVRGCDVYLLQPTSPPSVADNLMELLLAADACRRAGAAAVTAVVPYLGYARQDRRVGGRQPVSARVVADMIRSARIGRLVAVDLHTPSLEGFFDLPLEHLSAVPMLAGAVKQRLPRRAVVVAPDLGAVKLAESYARRLDLPTAVVHKVRQTSETVTVEGIAGEVQGRSPVVVDDMVSTGGTVEAAVNALLAAGSLPEIVCVATHALLVGQAGQRLSRLKALICTDSVAATKVPHLPLQVVPLAPLLAEAIRRLHESRSMADLVAHW